MQASAFSDTPLLTFSDDDLILSTFLSKAIKPNTLVTPLRYVRAYRSQIGWQGALTPFRDERLSISYLFSLITPFYRDRRAAATASNEILVIHVLRLLLYHVEMIARVPSSRVLAELLHTCFYFISMLHFTEIITKLWGMRNESDKRCSRSQTVREITVHIRVSERDITPSLRVIFTVPLSSKDRTIEATIGGGSIGR